MRPIVALVLGLVGGVVGALVVDTVRDSDLGPSSPIQVSQLSPDDPAVGETAIAAVANALSDSVVTITGLGSSDGGDDFTGFSTGTGVVISAEGEILTNAHVIEGADEVRVRFVGETEPRPARLVASDVGNDLALLKIAATDAKPVTFAAAGSVRVGDQVVAIGNALDLDGGLSVTSGIVSALRRSIVTESGVLNRLLQTDAPISSGNSGGPLVNLRGEVVGINTAVARGDASSAANNVGFAISVEEILRVVDQLRVQTGQRAEGYLGVGVSRRTDGGAGAIITSVESDSPAFAAGIRVGDVVLSVDGEPIDGQTSLMAAIRDSSPGQSVEIALFRSGDRVTVVAVLATRRTG